MNGINKRFVSKYSTMKSSAYLIGLAVLAALTFSNCKKNSVTTTTDYNPATTGSSWTYLSGTSVFKLTATSRDTVALGKTYKVLANNNGPNNYVAKTGNDYYRFGAVAAIGSSGVEELYLKDNLSVNATWTSNQTFTAPGYPQLTAQLLYTVKEKGVSRTVSGKSFTNVLHVRLDISLSGLSLGGGDFYYADGIGMIENNVSVTAPGQPSIVQAQLLTAYEIK